MMRENKVLGADNLSRVTFGSRDASVRDRLRIAEKALAVFESNPFLGQGFGTATYWNDEQTHNLYLSLLADYGIIGLFVIPALVWSLRRNSWDSYAFAVTILLWCFFNHNVFSYSFALISFAIQADERRSIPGLSWDVRHADDLMCKAS
jgi:hypothetical protein